MVEDSKQKLKGVAADTGSSKAEKVRSALMMHVDGAKQKIESDFYASEKSPGSIRAYIFKYALIHKIARHAAIDASNLIEANEDFQRSNKIHCISSEIYKNISIISLYAHLVKHSDAGMASSAFGVDLNPLNQINYFEYFDEFLKKTEYLEKGERGDRHPYRGSVKAFLQSIGVCDGTAIFEFDKIEKKSRPSRRGRLPDQAKSGDHEHNRRDSQLATAIISSLGTRFETVASSLGITKKDALDAALRAWIASEPTPAAKPRSRGEGKKDPVVRFQARIDTDLKEEFSQQVKERSLTTVAATRQAIENWLAAER